MAPPSLLLGPTKLQITVVRPNSNPNPSPPKLKSTISVPNPNPNRGPQSTICYTMKGSDTTYISTGNPCLDFFFHVVPDTPPEVLVNLLELAWNHDPLLTLKLVCNLVQGGTRNKEGFYTAALWLHEHHPKTLACNVKAIAADFGYFKDLLEILYRLLEGPDIWRIEKADHHGQKRKYSHGVVDGQKKTRSEKNLAKAEKALERYNSDVHYQFLHDKISEFFAELLKVDMGYYYAHDLDKISLASKWCPSLDSSYDRATLICESIARKIFRREEYQDMEEGHYAYNVRDRLRREVLVPLHKALELPEVYICANKWDKLPYKRVPSVAMNLYKNLFYKHDKERFEEYLADVKSGKSTIAAGALLPHEIIESALSTDSRIGPEVAELQWKRMVDDLMEKGKLTNCIAICDVSERMDGIPVRVSMALGLLISELSEEPWRGKLITFSANPEIHKVNGETLQEKTQSLLLKRDQGGSTNANLQKVFDKILEVALEGNLSEEKMIKRVFMFSDMEFDQASAHPWGTEYKVIRQKFKEEGYEKVPEIVFWNLRDAVATPVHSDEEGVALVSGFSKNLVTLFLEEGGILNPEDVMQQAISGEEYQKLLVFD